MEGLSLLLEEALGVTVVEGLEDELALGLIEDLAVVVELPLDVRDTLVDELGLPETL